MSADDPRYVFAGDDSTGMIYEIVAAGPWHDVTVTISVGDEHLTFESGALMRFIYDLTDAATAAEREVDQ